MNALTRFAALSFVVGLYVGCSPVKFSLDDSKCKDSGCVVVDGKYSFNYSATAGAGKVDILIVDDNSASMSFEQKRLAPRFANFIQNLDARHVDYRIAITTTDVSGGKFPQGGKLISYGDGSAYLVPGNANRVNLFSAAIQRPETLACENFIANWFRSNGLSSQESAEYANQYSQNCPSGDERGVYSANLVVQNNPGNFIRNDAHLSVIFLSDEDERSGLYNNGSPLNTLDQPATLINNVKTLLGNEKYNSLSLHSIIVKDSACLNVQNSQTLGNPANSVTTGMVQGSIGYVYQKFADSSWGVSADICSENYTGQLGNIQTRIESAIKDVMLNCANPEELVVTVSGAPVSHYLDGKVLKFNQYLAPGTSVSLSYKCSSL
ncbi:MIDAS family adhesin [Bdellovibrio svalbardensis]|uniref:VWFA domain-containing protein n=1 Tax=Bdellovibrio svalbardensis TaxID=2972972 RepID=A0ABT6DMH0_9BACT|nr:hypothetical protein [Bdellovibrio svalbardensis]MDG0818067.1 hypothetical protein [Bdellovibrio svalbardensis]